MDNYVVIKTIRAPQVSCKPNQKLQFRVFQEGETVSGKKRTEDETGFRLTPQIVVDDKWAIPLDHLQVLEPKTIAQSAMTEMDEIKKKAQLGKDLLGASKKVTNGMLVGFLVGAVIATFTKNSKVLFGIGGAIVGGYIGRTIHKKSKKDGKK